MPSIVIQEWDAKKVYPESTVIKYQGTYYVSTETNASSTPSDLANWVQFLTAAGSFLPELTPVNEASASATLTFSDAVSDEETVTIGSDVYEFDDDDAVTTGNIAVDVSGGATASEAATALVAAITASATGGYSAVADTADVVVSYDTPGSAGNDIAVATDCADGAWDEDTLVGGVDATEGAAGTMAFDSTYLYVCVDTNDWRRISLGSAF